MRHTYQVRRKTMIQLNATRNKKSGWISLLIAASVGSVVSASAAENCINKKYITNENQYENFQKTLETSQKTIECIRDLSIPNDHGDIRMDAAADYLQKLFGHLD